MSIADRALAAHEAHTSAKQMEREAFETRRHAYAANEIVVAAERNFGIELAIDSVEQRGSLGLDYEAVVSVDDDVDLILTYTYNSRSEGTGGKLECKTRPAEQLYWDLDPPFKTRREFSDATGITGGTYACFGLSAESFGVTDLASLGHQIERVRKAREQWNAQHGQKAA